VTLPDLAARADDNVVAMSAASVVEAPSEPAPLRAAASPATQPGFVRRLVGRFALVAFGLYHLPLKLNNYPSLGGDGFREDGLAHDWGRVFGQVGLWIARHVFQMTGPMPQALGGDNGDTAEEFCRLLFGVVVAIAAAVIWTAADRRRPRARWVEPALRLILRYSIAIGLASYGMAKIYPLQFGPLPATALETRLGELHPMALLWSFMEYSQPYVLFAGIMEMLVVLLVSFRRTATLGALLCVPVMANVAIMNWCYSVPVKLFSTMTLLSAVVLVAYDARRIGAALGFWPIPPLVVEPRRSRRMAIAGWILKIILVGGAIVSSAVEMDRILGTMAARQSSPLTGSWEAKSFARDGRDLTPTADPSRWRRMIVSLPRVAIRFEDDKLVYCSTTIEDAAHSLALDCPRTKQTGALRWTRDGDGLRLEGTFAGAPVAVALERLDPAKLRLLTTQFQWTYD
jgi:hypothetical protein